MTKHMYNSNDPIEVVMGAFSSFQESHNKRVAAQESKINEIQEQTDRIEELLNRPLNGVPNRSSGKKASRYAVTADGKKLPILAKDEHLQAHHPANHHEESLSLGDYVRASMGIRQNSALQSGPATVASNLSAQIIDAVREKNTLIRAGASTLMIDSPTVISRIDTDPVIYVHSEGVADISKSIPVFSGVELDPKMLVAQVPLSVEMVADSANLDALLRTSLAGALASKLDSLGIAALLADVNIEESTVAHDPATWPGLTAAVGAHLALNGDLPKAVISNATDFNSRNSSVLATSGEWINKPTYLNEMLDLFTTGMATGKMVFGDFATGLLLAMRQDLRLEVVRWSGAADATHLLVAYLRGQFYVTQPKSLFRGLKTVV